MLTKGGLKSVTVIRRCFLLDFEDRKEAEKRGDIVGLRGDYLR